VFVSSLAVSKDLALQIAQQEQEQREREEAEAKAQAEAAAAAAEAEALAASSPQPPESSRPATQAGQQSAAVQGAPSEAAEPEPSPEEVAARAEAEAAAAEAARQAREASITARADGLVDVFTQQHSLITDIVGKPAGSLLPDGRMVERNDVVFVTTTAEPGVPDEKLQLGVCGISFRLGDRKSSFPSVETDDHLIPEPFCMQVSGMPTVDPLPSCWQWQAPGPSSTSRVAESMTAWFHGTLLPAMLCGMIHCSATMGCIQASQHHSICADCSQAPPPSTPSASGPLQAVHC
jgi:hypothetical protein